MKNIYCLWVVPDKMQIIITLATDTNVSLLYKSIYYKISCENTDHCQSLKSSKLMHIALTHLVHKIF